MYIYRHDTREAIAVWVFDRTTIEEWELHFEHLRDLATWSGQTGKRAAALLLATNFERPDPKRRAELARCTEAPGYDPYVAFIAPNAALRAVLTMFRWVQKTPKYELDFFATSRDGATWLEDKRGERLHRLREFLAEIRIDYRRAAGVLP
ncbi:MAG TPA: hypothetical protein VNO21_15975 [Polyangiaceae bacterium]|nr:hypothetical protein [Polyangiaceae bacterium]